MNAWSHLGVIILAIGGCTTPQAPVRHMQLTYQINNDSAKQQKEDLRLLSDHTGPYVEGVKLLIRAEQLWRKEHRQDAMEALGYVSKAKLGVFSKLAKRNITLINAKKGSTSSADRKMEKFRSWPRDDPEWIGDLGNWACRNGYMHMQPSDIDTDELSFWKARKQECSGKTEEALSSYHHLAKRFFEHKRALRVGTLVLRRRAQILKRYSRERTAQAYQRLAAYWQLFPLGEFESETSIERANDTIWAGRYSSLVGKYKLADYYLREAEKILYEKRSSDLKERNDLLIEAAIVRSNRIFIDQGKFESALAEIQRAQKVDSADKKWAPLLLWLGALYHYALKQPKAAIDNLDALIMQHTDTYYEEQALFWKYRIAKEQGLAIQAASKKRLILRYPLGFYTVVGLQSDLAPFFQKQSYEGIAEVLNSDEKTRALREQSNVLCQLYERRWCILMAKEIHERAFKVFDERLRLALHAQASLIYGQEKNYFKSVSLLTYTSSFSEGRVWMQYPELMRVYFPTPFLWNYKQGMTRHGVPHTWGFAVSRQESTFRERVVSPAKAYGMMQMTIPTAKKWVTGKTEDCIRSLLLQAQFNINLGMKFLSELKQRYPHNSAAIFAAYNAGEYMVDRWLKKRPNFDNLLWIELIPFRETRNYVKLVMRNEMIYQRLLKNDVHVSID